MIKTLKLFILMLLSMASFTSCERKDDIEEIFIDKTWYMNGKTFNGIKSNDDVKHFYENDKNGYFIQFKDGTFTCALSHDIVLSGKWKADGKKQTIILSFDNIPSNLPTFDREVMEILKNGKSYKSGADYLSIKKDRSNYIMFGLLR